MLCGVSLGLRFSVSETLVKKMLKGISPDMHALLIRDEKSMSGYVLISARLLGHPEWVQKDPMVTECKHVREQDDSKSSERHLY